MRLSVKQFMSAQVVTDTILKKYEGKQKERNILTDMLKATAKELILNYEGNIKIEIDVNKKLGDAKIRITEYDI